MRDPCIFPLPNPHVSTDLATKPKMETSLLDLPNEVVHDVVALLEGRELKALRLSCRRLHDNATPFLFTTLYISCLKPNLDVFNLVAANPVLLGGVHELIVDDTTISPSLMNQDVFRFMSRQHNLWEKRKLPYFSQENWDDEGRIWSTEADDEFFALLKFVYEGHEANRLQQRDVTAVKNALGGMTSLRTLVLTNRTADDAPLSGAQSEHNTSPVVKAWRKVGEGRRERPPFPPRAEWWHPLQDDQFEADEAFDMDYVYDGIHEYLVRNGGSHFHDRPVIELDDNDEQAPDSDGQPHEYDSAMFSDHDEQNDHADDADHSVNVNDNFQDENTDPPQNSTLHLPQSSLLAPTRALKREARGLSVAIQVLMDPVAQSRLTQFRIDASTDTLADVQTPGLSMRIFDFVSPPFAFRLANCFAATFLTQCSLVLANGRDHFTGQEILDQGQVGSVLAAMPGLTDLSIEAHNLAVIGAIPEDMTFQHLKSASFFCGLVSQSEIRHFVRQHGNTLQDLMIAYCSLDDVDPSWEDVVEDLKRMQDTGRTNLESVSIISAYSSIPFTGCGRNKTKLRPAPNEEVYSWCLGVDETIVPCPTEDLGHRAL